MARVVAVLLGYDYLPGTTRHPLLLLVAADHPDGAARDQGRRGRRVHLRRRRDRSASYVDSGSTRLAARTPQNPLFADALARTATTRRRRGAEPGPTRARTARCPTSTSRWARPRRTSPQIKGITRAGAGRVRRALAEPGREGDRQRLLGSARSPRSPCPTAPSCRADDGPRAGVTLRASSGLKPVFRPDGTVTAGNCCPLNDGAAALVIMSDTKARELGLTPLARIVSTGVTGLSPEIMGLGPVEASRQALARAGMTIDDIDLVEINEAFAAQVIPSLPRPRHRPWTSSTSTAARSPSATRSA